MGRAVILIWPCEVGTLFAIANAFLNRRGLFSSRLNEDGSPACDVQVNVNGPPDVKSVGTGPKVIVAAAKEMRDARTLG